VANIRSMGATLDLVVAAVRASAGLELTPWVVD
jgi:hypothetical protein